MMWFIGIDDNEDFNFSMNVTNDSPICTDRTFWSVTFINLLVTLDFITACISPTAFAIHCIMMIIVWNLYTYSNHYDLNVYY